MSYDFNGTTAYGKVTSTPINNSPFSIVAYAMPDAGAASRVICVINAAASASDYYLLQIAADDTVQATTRDGGGVTASATSTATISEAGTWQLLHGTWATSDASRRVGIDASNYVNDPTANSPDPRPDEIWVGARPIGPLAIYDGKMAYVAIYDRVLSDSELTELLTVQPESASSYTDCVIYWDMRDDEGTTAIPNAKNPGTYDLTINGASWSTDNPTLGAGGDPEGRLIGGKLIRGGLLGRGVLV